MRRALGSIIVLACVASAVAQQMDNPVALPIYYYGEGIVQSGGQIESSFAFGSSLGEEASAWGTYLYAGSTLYSPVATGMVIPGKDYSVQVTSLNFAVVTVHFAEIPGYNIYVGPTVAISRQSAFTLGSNYSFHFRLEAINDLTSSMANKRGGECSSLTEDKAIWYIGLGRLRNGRGAGAVGFRAASITSDLWKTSSLMYDIVDSSEVGMTRDGNGYITSITSRDVKLVMDAYNPSGTEYNIYVYQSQNLSTAFITYTIRQEGSSGIRIIKNEGGTYWATVLTQSGSTWTHYDWRAANSSGAFLGTAGVYPHPDKRTVSTVGIGSTTTHYGITNSVSTPTLVKQKNFVSHWWGWELGSVTWGPGVSNAPTTSYSYYSDTGGAGWPRAIATMIEPNGRWTKYDYYNGWTDSRSGLVRRIYRPWLNDPSTPGAATTTNCLVETYDYTLNFDGSVTAPMSRETTVNGTPVSRTTWSHTFSFASVNNRTVARTQQTDYWAAGSGLMTTILAYRLDDPDTFFQGKVHAITRPDGTKDAFAYYLGTWDSTARTFNPNGGSDRLILCLHGQSGTGTGATYIHSWTVNPSGGSSATWTVDPVYLIANLSTISETVIDTNGRVVFQAENIFNGTSSSGTGNDGSRERISGTANTYSGANLLTKQLDIARTVTGVEVAVGYVYAAGLLTQKTDIDGVRTAYTYDHHLRNETVTTADGGTGSYPAKTQTLSYNLADQMLTAQDCSCSPSAKTYYYQSGGTGRVDYVTEPRPGGGTLMTSFSYPSAQVTTTTLPTSATLTTTTYLDGRVQSETGTGRVAAYFDYAVASYSVTKTIREGSGSEYPWTSETTDGLGRVSQQRTPQVGWTTSQTNKAVRKTFTYHSSTGQLIKVATTDEANGNVRLLPDHVYEYLDGSNYPRMGLVLREGEDLGSNGVLDLATNDRITTHTTSFYKDTWAGGYSGWLRNDLTGVYRTLGNGSDVTTVSDVRTRFTRFNNGSADGSSAVISDVVEVDASGRWRNAIESVEPASRRRKAVEQYLGTGFGDRKWTDGYLESETSTSGRTRTFAYNSLGLQSSVTESGTGEVTSSAYHDGTSYLSGVTRTTGQGGTHTTSYTYYWKTTDPSETPYHKVRETDAAGNATYTDYDATGMAWRVWGSGARPSVTGYDAFGRRTSLTTYQGGTSAATWDGSSFSTPATTNWTLSVPTGLVTSKSYPVTGSVGYTYTALGLPKTRTWARNVTTTYDYFDGSAAAGYVLTGELRRKSYSDVTPAVDFTYTRFGAPATVNEAGITNRIFSYRSDLKRDAESLGAFFSSKSLTSTYDSIGRPTGHSFNGSATVSTTVGFNGVGQVGSVQAAWGGTTATFTLGYASGTDWVQTITHGNFTRTQTLGTQRSVLDRVLTQWNGSTRGDFDSEFDGLGRRAHLWRRGTVAFGGDNQQHFSYTPRHELDSEWNDPDPVRQTIYNYDLAGNRNWQWEPQVYATWYTDDASNRYTEIVGQRPEPGIAHDADGNLTQDGTWTYAWDGENRLKSMSRSGQTLTFTYDYLDRRIRKLVTGTDAKDRKYVWDGWKLVAETTGDGYTIHSTFVWGPDYSNGSCGGAGGAGGLLGIYTSGPALNYAVHDAMGNVAGYLDASGNTTAAYEYNGYGMLRQQTGAMASLPFGFASQYTDRETGLVYYGLRYYNGTHGRFINRDPIEEAGGNNLYAFVGNDPVNRWDVLGLGCRLISWYESTPDFSDPDYEGGLSPAPWYRRGYWECDFDTTPIPSVNRGSFNRPDLGNLGWDLDWRKSDPRAGNGGGTEADGRGMTPVYSHRVNVSFGTIEWGAQSRGQSGVNFFARFTPGQNNTCENISFIQVTLESSTGGTALYPAPAAYYRNFASDAAGGARVDHIAGQTDPYYGAEPISGSGSWGSLEEPGQVGNGPRGVEASMRDGPTVSTDARSGLGLHNKRFEACAVCIDTGVVYGCVRWGLSAEDAAGSPAVVTGSGSADFRATPSREWQLAVGRWNGIARARGWSTFP